MLSIRKNKAKSYLLMKYETLAFTCCLLRLKKLNAKVNLHERLAWDALRSRVGGISPEFAYIYCLIMNGLSYQYTPVLQLYS
jgi:hypothetical protein